MRFLSFFCFPLLFFSFPVILDTRGAPATPAVMYTAASVKVFDFENLDFVACQAAFCYSALDLKSKN